MATYQYDANGNRVSKTLADGTKISYLVDSNMPYAQVASETATSPTGATTETDYLYGLERIQQTRAGQGTYYHDDGLGGTRVLTDQTGTVTDSYEYDDYGALQSQTGTTQNSFMYAGEQFDQDAGLYYNRARYLDTNAGRFVGLDPYAGNLSQPVTLNKYAYAGNDPVNGRDPSGLMNNSDLQVAEAGEQELAQAESTAGQAIGQQFKRKMICQVGDLAGKQGVYIFIEETEAGLIPYIGMGWIGARIAVHQAERRIFGQFFAFVEIAGGEGMRRTAEQILINTFVGSPNGLPKGWTKLPEKQRIIANLYNSISPKRWCPLCK